VALYYNSKFYFIRRAGYWREGVCTIAKTENFKIWKKNYAIREKGNAETQRRW